MYIIENNYQDNYDNNYSIYNAFHAYLYDFSHLRKKFNVVNYARIRI